MKIVKIVSIILLLLLLGGYGMISHGKANARANSRLSLIIDYLRQAKGISISSMVFNHADNSVLSNNILYSQNAADVSMFVNLLKQEMAVSEFETELNRMEVFTPDYIVELACSKAAIIDFIFYEDTNAAILKNDDYYFFVEFGSDSAEALQEYFESLK